MAIAGVKEILDSSKKRDLKKLSVRAREIDVIKENKEMRQIVSEIKRTMRKTGLTSLSAPGIGYDRRIFCIAYGDQDIKTYINPIIAKAEGLELSKEICSSIPGKKYLRLRNPKIEVMYTTPLNTIESKDFLGLAAIVYQHEMDHIDGLLLSDIGLEIDDDFDNASEEERQEVIKMYLDSIDLMDAEISKAIEEDPLAKKTKDAIAYMTAAEKGEIEFEPIEPIKEETKVDA